jgi:glycopeptide antibiotics resistance protein
MKSNILQTKVLVNQRNNVLFYTAFSFYLFLLIWIIALKFNADWVKEIGEYFRSLPLQERVGMGFIPFYSMFKNGFYFNLDYFMNVIIYLPLGIYLKQIFENKNWLIIIIVIFSSLIFEIIQLLTGFGGCDGSDLFCNSLGGILGILLGHLFKKILSNKSINVINLSIIIVFTPFVVYALINTIVHWDMYIIS